MNLTNFKGWIFAVIATGAVFGPACALADSIRGFVQIQNSQVFFQPVIDGKPLTEKALPIATTIGIRTSLLDLRSGDYVVVSGRLIDTDRDGITDEVSVQAIESVGLNSLIGTWRSAKWEVVRFEDFSRMSLYRPRFRLSATPSSTGLNPVTSASLNPSRMSLSKLKDLNYSLAPEQGSIYSIFLVEKKITGPAPVYVGRLHVKESEKEKRLTLEIFDPKTGESAEVLSLSPVRE